MAEASAADSATESFLALRDLLFTVAYEMLGSATDAEDVLQETWFQWTAADRSDIRSDKAYLLRIATRQALMRLRTNRRRRESYVGPWLPEPLLTVPDVADDVALAESASMAMLLVLETLGPVERVVFVLREVFDVPYDEIASSVNRSPDAVRQIAHRAREHVKDRKPRGEVSPALAKNAVNAFRRTVQTGDLRELLDVLAPDVVLLTDGGGVAEAAVEPIVGPVNVAEVIARLHQSQGVALRLTRINGHTELVVEIGGSIDVVLALRFDDALITGVYAVRNPVKLSHLDAEIFLRR